MKNRIFAGIVALAVAVTMMFGTAATVFAEGGGVNAEVTVSLQTELKFIVHKTLIVNSKLAEEYGYEDKVANSKVSALDALVALHIDKYGNNIDTVKENLTMNAGNPSKMMGISKNGSFSGFAVNENYKFQEGSTTTGASLNEAVLTDGDRLDCFWYEDPYWMDMVTVVTDNGEKALKLSKTAGENFTIGIEGFMFMDGYRSPGYEPIEGAMICLIDEDGNAVPELDEEQNPVLTNAEGKVTLNLPEGTYYLTACQGENEERLIMPWCELTVKAAGNAEESTEPSTPAESSGTDKEEPSADNTDTRTMEVNTAKAVNTGDDSNITVFVLIAAAAAICGCVAVFARKRNI